MTARDPIAVYYGDDQLPRLVVFDRVVLQPSAYSPRELAVIAHAGSHALGYLSLSEDSGPSAVWQRPEHDPDWGSARVFLDHPGWTSHVLGQAADALRAGFHGLFLDNLNVEWTHPEDLPHLLALVGAVREQSGGAYLLANRGFGLLPELAALVDGVLFESFTARWVDGGYAPWPTDVLEGHARVAERLLGLDLELYALDYADDEELATFARRRARQFGMSCFVSNRALSRLPDLADTG